MKVIYDIQNDPIQCSNLNVLQVPLGDRCSLPLLVDVGKLKHIIQANSPILIYGIKKYPPAPHPILVHSQVENDSFFYINYSNNVKYSFIIFFLFHVVYKTCFKTFITEKYI